MFSGAWSDPAAVDIAAAARTFPVPPRPKPSTPSAPPEFPSNRETTAYFARAISDLVYCNSFQPNSRHDIREFFDLTGNSFAEPGNSREFLQNGSLHSPGPVMPTPTATGDCRPHDPARALCGSSACLSRHTPRSELEAQRYDTNMAIPSSPFARDGSTWLMPRPRDQRPQRRTRRPTPTSPGPPAA